MMLISSKRIFSCFIVNYFVFFFQELSSTYGGEPRGKFILWKNKDMTIDEKTMFWKTWFEPGIYFVQDLLRREILIS